MTSLKMQSVLTSGNSGGDTAPALQITFAPSHPLAQGGLQITDYNNAPIMALEDTSNGLHYWPGGAYNSVFDTHGMRVNNDTFANPQCFSFPDGATQGMNWWAGTGIPSTSTICGAAQQGDMYTRRDGGAGTYVYRCTVAGTPGTWVAVL